MEAIIKGKKYQVEELPACGEGLRKDLMARGWDGKQYAIHGPRGACFMGFRSAATGKFELGTRV